MADIQLKHLGNVYNRPHIVIVESVSRVESHPQFANHFSGFRQSHKFSDAGRARSQGVGTCMQLDGLRS